MKIARRFPSFAACALATVLALPAHADDDFGLWTSIAAEKKLGKHFDIEAAFDFRAEQKLQHAARYAVSLGAGYKPAKWLKFSAGYAFLRDHSPLEAKVNFTKKGKENGYNVDEDYWRSKHRVFVDVTGKLSVGRFTLSLRERYQFTHYVSADCTRYRYRDLVQGGYTGEVYTWGGEDFMSYEQATDHKATKNAHYLRSRLQIEYNIRHCPLTPFASYELSCNLSEALDAEKSRLCLGFDWKISKRHVLSAAYLYQNGHDDDSDGNIHVIDLGYKFKF